MESLILASTSPTRRKLLEGAGVRLQVEDPRVDEHITTPDGPEGLASALARRKARAVALHHPGAWVLGADQVVHQRGEIFGKPRSRDDHLARLKSMRGQTHDLITAWVLLGPGDLAHGTSITRMKVRADLEDHELAHYVSTGEGTFCAGGYAAEGKGSFLFERVEGDWFNVLGLPLLDVLTALRARGWRLDAR